MKKIAGAVFIGIVLLYGIDILVFYTALQQKNDRTGLFVSDPKRGYALTPGFKGWVTAGYRFPVTINAQGYRGPDWTPDAELRVLVAGNSYVFGLPLSLEDGFVAKATRMTAGKATFYNLGVPSYGVPHSLETIRQECPKIKPSHVFYIYDYNDARLDHMTLDSRTVIDGTYLSTWADDRMTRLPTPLSADEISRQKSRLGKTRSWQLSETLSLKNIRTFLAQRHWHPRQLVESLYISLGFGDGQFARYLKTNKPNFLDTGLLRKAAKMILEMQEVAKACGAGFSLVILPNANEAYYGLKEPATEQLVRILSTKTVEILDLRKRVDRGTILDLPLSGYYNKRATDWVAKVLVERLRKQYGIE